MAKKVIGYSREPFDIAFINVMLLNFLLFIKVYILRFVLLSTLVNKASYFHGYYSMQRLMTVPNAKYECSVIDLTYVLIHLAKAQWTLWKKGVRTRE